MPNAVAERISFYRHADFSIDELGLRNQDQRVLLYIVSMVIVSILATSGLRPLRITVVVGSIGRSSIS